MKPVAAVVLMLEQALAAAKRGEAREAFVMLRIDGEWDEDYLTTDADDLAASLRTARIRLGQTPPKDTRQ